MSALPRLSLAGVRAGYAGSEVLTGLNLVVAPGEVVALLGRNGMGKSTMVGAIAGTLPLTAGAIHLDGQAVSAMAPSVRYRAGLRTVRQDQPVFSELSVSENLALVGCKNISSAAEIFPFLAHRGRQAAGTLSGGEQKMLALARTVVEPGTVWVLDEPTEGLQPANVDRCGELIAQAAARGVAVLLVEQHVDMAMSVAARWYLLEKGSIVDSGDVNSGTRAAIANRMTV